MGGRGLIRLKYVHAFRDRMGRMRYYFRRHGKRSALLGLPGSSEFMAAYAAQLNNASSQAKHKPTAAPGTFAALAICYYGSPQFQSLSATSRSNYLPKFRGTGSLALGVGSDQRNSFSNARSPRAARGACHA